MIDANLVRKLKQTNLSADGDKTRTRVTELWKSASKEAKRSVEQLSGKSRATIYRVYNTGSLSAKLAVPMAKAFNVDPDYLLAKTDAPGEYSEALIRNFLTERGYGKLLSGEASAKRRGRKKASEAAASAPAAPVAPSEAFTTLVATAASAMAKSANDSALSQEELLLLVQALLLREKAGIPDAVAKAIKLRALLLS